MKKKHDGKTHKSAAVNTPAAIAGAGEKKPHFKVFFYVVFAVFLALFLVSIYSTHGASLKGALFSDSSDTFMDHYNSVVYNQVDDPYEILVVYPPLASLLYKLCNMIIPADDYVTVVTDPAELAQERFIRVGQSFTFQFILYAVIALLIFLAALAFLKKGGTAEKLLFATVAILSAPFIYMADRGNNVLLPVAFTIFFLVFYKHDSKILREVALISLAVAIALKIYPVVFLVLLIADRKYKEFFRECIYIFVFLILPFFIFYNGLDSIRLMLRNLRGFDEKRTTEDNIAGNLDFKRIFFFLYGGLRRYTGITITESRRELYATLFRYGLSFICGLCGLFAKRQWKRVALLSAVLYGFPGSASTYILLFMIIPLAMFLDDEKEQNVRNYAYLFCLALTIVPMIIKHGSEYDRYWPSKIASLAVAGMVFIAFLEMIFAFAAWNEARRRDKKRFFATAFATVRDYLKYMLYLDKKEEQPTLFDSAPAKKFSLKNIFRKKERDGVEEAKTVREEKPEEEPEKQPETEPVTQPESTQEATPETAETLETDPALAENSPENAAPVSAGEQPRGEEAENDA